MYADFFLLLHPCRLFSPSNKITHDHEHVTCCNVAARPYSPRSVRRESAFMRRHEGGTGCGTRARGESTTLATPRAVAGQPAGMRSRSGPAAVRGESQRCRVARSWTRGCIPHDAPRTSACGPPGQARAALAKSRACAPRRATPRIRGKRKERKTGRPRRPKLKAGADFVCLSGCLTSEIMSEKGAAPSVRPRASGDPVLDRQVRGWLWVPACAGTNGEQALPTSCAPYNGSPPDCLLRLAEDFGRKGGEPLEQRVDLLR